MLVGGKEDIYCRTQLHVGVCERENLVPHMWLNMREKRLQPHVLVWERKEIYQMQLHVGVRERADLVPHAIEWWRVREKRIHFVITSNDDANLLLWILTIWLWIEAEPLLVFFVEELILKRSKAGWSVSAKNVRDHEVECLIKFSWNCMWRRQISCEGFRFSELWLDWLAPVWKSVASLIDFLMEKMPHSVVCWWDLELCYSKISFEVGKQMNLPSYHASVGNWWLWFHTHMYFVQKHQLQWAMKLAMGKQRMLMVTQRVLIKRRRRRRWSMEGLKCFMQLWHLVWVTLLSKDNIQMRKSTCLLGIWHKSFVVAWNSLFLKL